jgi:hypothetical protein
MTAVTTTSVTVRTAPNYWLASLYGGLFAAIFAALAAWLFPTSIWLFGLLTLLIGVGPVLGYQLAAGRIFSNWGSIFGGLLGFILLVLGWILWPILVGAFTKGQSIGKLLLGSISGFLLGLSVLLLVSVVMGQNPNWISWGWTLLWAVWGGTSAAVMAAYGDWAEELR